MNEELMNLNAKFNDFKNTYFKVNVCMQNQAPTALITFTGPDKDYHQERLRRNLDTHGENVVIGERKPRSLTPPGDRKAMMYGMPAAPEGRTKRSKSK